MRNCLLVVVLIAGILLAAACAPAAPSSTPPPKATSAPAPTSAVEAPKAAATAPSAKPAQPTAAAPAAKADKPAAAAPAALQTVKLGELRVMADTIFYLAIEKGYFKEQGIEVQLERFASAADEVAPLATGDIHVGSGNPSAGWFNALARGLNMKAIAALSRPKAPNDSNWWMVRSDLKDQIKTFTDVKGKTINTLGVANAVYWKLGESLATQGLTLKDVNTVQMGAPDASAALKGKSIDITIAVEPNAVLLAEQGLAGKWRQLTQDGSAFDINVMVYSERWVKENPELAKKFTLAFLKGHREFARAARGGPNRPEVVNVATKYTALKDAAMYEKMTWNEVPVSGYVDKAPLKTMQDWFIKNGLVSQAVDVDKLVDDSFLDSANKQLGEPKD